MEPSCNELHHKLTSGGPNRRTPTEEPGRGTVELTVGNLGGNPQNMWSPPEGLRGTRLYLSAATGEVTDQEVADYSTYPITNQIAGSLLGLFRSRQSRCRIQRVTLSVVFELSGAQVRPARKIFCKQRLLVHR